VVSELVSNLEGQIGVTLFDRSGPLIPRAPTPEGVVLLADDARRPSRPGLDHMKARAQGHGVRTGNLNCRSLSTCSFRSAAITEAAKEFRVKFPGTTIAVICGSARRRVSTGARRHCRVSALLDHWPTVPATFTTERLTGVAMVMVAAGEHPLAQYKGTIPKSELAKHVQLVLTDRSSLSKGREFGVMSPSTWRLADLFCKALFPAQRPRLGWACLCMSSKTILLPAGW